MPYSLVIFDLDGTLADSFPWFQRNVNEVADRFGFRRVREEDVDTLRHASTREILSHLQVPRWKLPFIARHMRRLKTEQAVSIPLFDGVEAMLTTLAANGVRLALVSSDTEANAREKLGPSAALISDFDCAASIFGKPAKFRRVLKRAGVKPAQAIAIGDETRDIEAARATGIACGAVTWGYAARQALIDRKPDLVFERMEEIAGAVLANPTIPSGVAPEPRRMG
jgi:phosphoglycolate phosphatase